MSSDVAVGKYSLHILRRIFFLMDHAWSWQTLASRPFECFIGTSLGSPRNKSTPLDPSPRNHSTRGICSPGSAIHWRIMDRCHTTTSTTNKRLQNHRSSGISCYMSDAENMEKRVGSPGAGGKKQSDFMWFSTSMYKSWKIEVVWTVWRCSLQKCTVYR